MSGSHPLWLEVVNGIIGSAPRAVMVDVCCGATAVTRHLDYPIVECCDLEPRHPDVPENWKFTQRSAIHFLEQFPCKYADLVICSDGLEHFTKVQGYKLLRQMERAGKLAIIFTPTGDTKFDPEATDPHTHKSSWTAEHFAKLGWESDYYPDWHPTLGWGGIFAWNRIS